jgi:hypothetical protein
VHANVKVIVFDTYDTTQSLKEKTRISRKKQRPVPPRNFIISLETDIEKVRIDELLASKTTKHSMAQLLMQQTIDHIMKTNRIDYVIAGNRTIHWHGTVSNEVNNHEEADTLLISCLVLATGMIECSAVDVYSADTRCISAYSVPF